RIIAASNRTLEKLVAQGLFREDLFYRVRVFPIRIPALRERPEDIDPLIDWYLAHLPQELGKRAVRLGPAARELRNCLERAIILADDDGIEERHLRLGPEPVLPAASREESLEEARDRAAS